MSVQEEIENKVLEHYKNTGRAPTKVILGNAKWAELRKEMVRFMTYRPEYTLNSETGRMEVKSYPSDEDLLNGFQTLEMWTSAGRVNVVQASKVEVELAL